MVENKKTIQVSEDLYQALQDLKNVFSQLTGQQNLTDEDVVGILVSGFIESLNQQHHHDHDHHHDHNNGGGHIITE